jgi:hypothetical protein
MTALDEFIRNTAATYLQNIVFVDDKIYLKQLPVDIGNTPSDFFSGLKPPFTGEQIDEKAAPANEDGGKIPAEVDGSASSEAVQLDDLPRRENFHPRDLMESFARYGIVCALYEPREGFKCDQESDLFRLLSLIHISEPTRRS